MTTTTLSRNTLSPRASASRAAAPVPSLGARIWNALVALGARRAAFQMDVLARQYETTRPELARHLREAAQSGLNG